MIFSDFKHLFAYICKLKPFVVSLNKEQLTTFKEMFYTQKIPCWQLDLMWEFIWDDIDYITMYCVFKNSRII